MKKLDWYIIKKFLTTFFFSIFLFAVIAVAIDTSEKADDFVKSKLPFGRLVTEYYAGFIPQIIALLFPLFVFIAVIFFTSKMAGKSEIVAILASGTSYNRFLRPFFIAGVFLGSILWYGNHYVIPVANDIRTNFLSKYVDNNSTYNPLLAADRLKSKYFRLDANSYVGIHNYDTTNKTGSPFFMYTIKSNQLTANLRADDIRWDTGKKQWLLSGIIERKLNGMQETINQEAQRFVAFSDAGNKEQKTLTFNFKPLDLKSDDYTKDKLTTPQLDRFIKMEELRSNEGINTFKVERYRRDASAVSVLILALIGAVVASKKVRGGSGLHLAIGILTAVSYILFDRFSTIFSTKGSLQPMLAAWLPNIIFMFVWYWLYKKAPK
jgi:lipopolysaccharide export system permease protein